MKRLLTIAALLSVTGYASAQSGGRKTTTTSTTTTTTTTTTQDKGKGGKGKGDDHAQKTPEQRATDVTARLTKKLALTADQQPKVHALVLARETSMDSLRSIYKGQDRSVWEPQRKKVKDNFDAGMKSVLTPDQYTKWKADKEENHEPGQNPPPPPGGDHRKPEGDNKGTAH